MEVGEQIKLKFHGVDILHLNFEVKDKYSKDEDKISITLSPKVFYPKGEPRLFRIIMELELEAEDRFGLKVIGVGHFEFENNVMNSDLKKGFINVNAPAIMFPYIRSFVSTFTANTGSILGTINIPPQFFRGDLEEILLDQEDGFLDA